MEEGKQEKGRTSRERERRRKIERETDRNRKRERETKRGEGVTKNHNKPPPPTTVYFLSFHIILWYNSNPITGEIKLR